MTQIGLRLDVHPAQIGSLPQDGKNGNDERALLLQFLDQAVLESQFNSLAGPPPNPALVSVAIEDAVLPVFRCPSHRALTPFDAHLLLSGRTVW